AAEAIAEPIATLMAGANLSLNALSTKTRIPYTTLYVRLHEPTKLTMGNLLRIADALAIPAHVLTAVA
ncbi:MAG TPA: hypothetical protein VIH37_09775, partial [Candidatus Limnocylindrales bacterium]